VSQYKTLDVFVIMNNEAVF